MPIRNPPAANAVNFTLRQITVPVANAVDFDLSELAPPVGPVVTSPLGPTDGSGVAPSGTLTSDVPLDGTPLQYLELAAVSPRGTLYCAALPSTP